MGLTSNLSFSWLTVNNNEVRAVAASAVEVVKVPAHTVPTKTDPWKTSREPASLWSGDIDGKKKGFIGKLLHCRTLHVLV